MRPVVVVVVALLAASGCAGAVIVPTQSDVSAVQARYPGATLPQLQQGRALFVARCAGCHQLPLPGKRSPDEWPRIVDKMAPDAKIADADKALIERYLVAASARSRPGAGAAAR